MITNKKPARLHSLLITLTTLTILFQLALFFINNKVNNLMDALVQNALASQIFHPIILLPIISFILIQLGSYIVFICWVWFITISCGEYFKLSEKGIYFLGLFFWMISLGIVLLANNHFFSDSFFAVIFRENGIYHPKIEFLTLKIFSGTLIAATLIAYLNTFTYRKHLLPALFFLSLVVFSGLLSLYTYFFAHSDRAMAANNSPNVIFIGLDSVRPDFTGFWGNAAIATPHIDQFLRKSVAYKNAYTPLARTFPAWMSILTGKYPKHNHARTNLADSDFIVSEDTLAKHLQKAGYETIYGTDEKRFSNILNAYGFDLVMGPHMGVNDFLIGGLSDFPLTNLLINTPMGRFLFPFNYGNRAANITYEPKTFLDMIKIALRGKHDKPLFLAIHLCVSHWPYTWAGDHQSDGLTQADRYASSVKAVDAQLGDLLNILKKDGLLKNAVVVLLSDHGTTVGLPHDRMISREKYQGDAARIKWIPLFPIEVTPSHFKLHSIPKFNLETSYGQGTDVLSLKQYHVLLAIQGFGNTQFPAAIVKGHASLLDVAPTILDFLKLPPLKKIDGINLFKKIADDRSLLLETGYKVPGIEEEHISVARVVKDAIHVFNINPVTGLLYVNPSLEKGTDKLKERAVLSGDWLLARYPDQEIKKLIPDQKHPGNLMFGLKHLPAYFVVANIKTGAWAIGLDSTLAKTAPLSTLLKQFNNFYGDEV